MAGHKTKYKEPKDFKKSQSKSFKKETRKDIKDYTAEDKDGRMNPNSVGKDGIQTNVPRKRDKLVIDDVENMVPKDKHIKSFYKVQGDHDPKHTKKVRAQLQDDDEKNLEDENLKREQLEKKISKLTKNQKEKLVREYIRRKIKKVLSETKNAKPDYLDFDNDNDTEESMKQALKDKENKNEQTNPADEETADEEPVVDEPVVDTDTNVAPDALATKPATEIPTATEPAAQTPEPLATDPLSQTVDAINKQKGSVKKAKFLVQAYMKAMADADPSDLKKGARLLARSVLRNALQPKS